MRFQIFEAQVSDKSGTADGEPLVCRSFTQAKKFLLDWLLTKRHNVSTGAPEIVAKPGVTATITPRQVDFDYPSEAEAKGFRPARAEEAAMPPKTFEPAKNDKGEWCLSEVTEAVKVLTPAELAHRAEIENAEAAKNFTAAQAKLKAAKAAADKAAKEEAAVEAARKKAEEDAAKDAAK